MHVSVEFYNNDTVVKVTNGNCEVSITANKEGELEKVFLDQDTGCLNTGLGSVTVSAHTILKVVM